MLDVIVLGAINQDFVVHVRRRPLPGETVVSPSVSIFDGGKGANQSVAAARWGAATALIGCVGTDPAGMRQWEALRREGVDVSRVDRITDSVTGVALITVTDDGENSLVVGLGANTRVSPDRIRDAWLDRGPARVAVAQAEVGAEAVDAFAAAARTAGARLVLNAAPVHRFARETLAVADPVVVNEHEAAQLAAHIDGAGPDDPTGDGVTAARRLVDVLGARSAIVTLGARGAVVADAHTVERIDSPRVDAVDTTGAGDVFVGALAAELARQRPLRDAARTAVAVGAFTVTRTGARTAPTAAELAAVRIGAATG